MDIESYRRIIQGRVNKAQGKYFENLIEASCEFYKITGEAFIEKNQEPFVVTQSLGNGTFKGHFGGEAQTDYTGILRGGRGICFEAKHTQADRIKQDAVKRHQVEDLHQKQKLGALCFILVSIKDRVYRIPFDDWMSMKEICGHKYMTQEDARDYEIKIDNHGIYKILEGIEREQRA